jgi:ring-1,2-phenylacetyl-CoA epoxidase subunit PaaB
MIWEVFRQEAEDSPHIHCGNVHAPDREMAKQFSVIQHGRRKPTVSLWVAPQEKVTGVYYGEDTTDTDTDGAEASWEVFRQDEPGGYHTHCGDVSATDSDSAKHAALEQFVEDDEPHEFWVVRTQYVGEVNADQVKFGGTTDKSYRFAQTYNVTPAAAEVEASESEQVDAERRRGDL